MTFDIHELPKVKSDKRHILEWLLERSPRGGRAWLKAYDDALVTLGKHADSFGEALGCGGGVDPRRLNARSNLLVWGVSGATVATLD